MEQATALRACPGRNFPGPDLPGGAVPWLHRQACGSRSQQGLVLARAGNRTGHHGPPVRRIAELDDVAADGEPEGVRRAGRQARSHGIEWRLMQDFRSEEHTSELQSLMRISYAVFCLKKKKKQNKYINIYTTI